MKKSITDIMDCPMCNSESTDIVNTDEIEFDYGGTGHYYFDCYCKDCGKYFRKHMEFKYEITKDY